MKINTIHMENSKSSKHLMQQLLTWQTQSILEVKKKIEMKSFEQPKESTVSHKHTCLQR